MFNVTIVGRPNVGKSTLFNFLVGKQIALTDPTAGLTRDRKISLASLYDIKFSLTDTGGYDDLSISINKKIWEQSLKAISEADCILFIVDGKEGLSPLDKEIANLLRKFSKNVILCVNKIDTRQAKENMLSFHELAMNYVVGLSAVHGIGMTELHNSLEEVYNLYLENNPSASENQAKQDITIAFVGKPNVGKSTIINTLLGDDRLIVNDEAGTTRDSIYIDTIYKDKIIKIMDTAGLRRRSKVSHKLERMSNSDTISSINFTNVAVLVISAEDGLTKQDMVLAKHIIDEGRGLVLVVNKLDLVKNKKAFLHQISVEIENAFFQIKKPYIIGISALKDKELTNIFDAAFELYQKWQFKVTTSKLNIWLREVISNNPTPSIKGRKIKVKYISQIKSRPPTIQLWSNFEAKKFPDAYLRYLQNELLKYFNLWGCTLRIQIKKSDNPYHDKINQK